MSSLPGPLAGRRILNENPGTSRIPIVVLTARTHPSERDPALRLGAHSYATKPFSTRVFLREIESALEVA